MTQPHTMTGTCHRCDGTGTIRAFGHYANGRCFACHGTGKLSVTLSEGEAVMVEEGRRKRAWLETLATMRPEDVVSRFRALPASKLWAIRDACAGWDVEGARLAWWAACTVLCAWPGPVLSAADIADAF